MKRAGKGTARQHTALKQPNNGKPGRARPPAVMERSKPKGLPMARQACPTRTPAESPSDTGRSSEAGAFTLSTARSRALSAPSRGERETGMAVHGGGGG